MEDNKDLWDKWYDHYEDLNRRIGAYLRPVPQLKGRVNGTGGSNRWSFPFKSSIDQGFEYAVQLTDGEVTVEDAYTTERDEWVTAVSRTYREFRALPGSLKNPVPSITIDFTVNYNDLGGHCNYNAYYNAIF